MNNSITFSSCAEESTSGGGSGSENSTVRENKLEASSSKNTLANPLMKSPIK
jgi:hypothetical protein